MVSLLHSLTSLGWVWIINISFTRYLGLGAGLTVSPTHSPRLGVDITMSLSHLCSPGADIVISLISHIGCGIHYFTHALNLARVRLSLFHSLIILGSGAGITNSLTH